MGDIEKYLQIALPEIDAKLFLNGCRAMDAGELQTLRSSLKARTDSLLPSAPQLAHIPQKTDRQNNRAFCI